MASSTQPDILKLDILVPQSMETSSTLPFGLNDNSPLNKISKDSSSTKGSQGVDKTDTLLPVSRLAIVFCGFMLVFSLVGIDQTIIVTALPTIASDFNAVSSLSWIASAYFLSEAGLILFFGKLVTIAPPKIVLLACVAIFELGSLFCAIAPSVNFLIFGRAVAGAGAGGIWIAINSILTKISTLKQRPILLGLFGAVFAICSMVGPLIGGVFADKLTWRYLLFRSNTSLIEHSVNTPDGAFIGGAGSAIVLFTLPKLPVFNTDVPNLPTNEKKTFLQRHKQLNAWVRLNWIGVFLSFASVTLLLVALQSGGNTKPWTDGAVLAPLILGALLFISFGFWEYYQGSKAILPIKLLKRRNVFGACVLAIFIYWAFSATAYYLPLLYQLRGHSAEKSGLDILPYMISGVTFSLISGGIITATGHIWSLIAIPPILAAVMFGLISTTEPDTSFARLIGFQILLGAGLGSVTQNPLLVVQAEFVHDPEAVSLVTSLMTFCTLIGSAIGLAANGAVFSGVLHSQISKLSNILSSDLRNSILQSITFISTLPDDLKGPVSKAYITAIDRVFLAAVVPTAISVFVAFIIEKKRISLKQIGDTMG